MTREMNTQTMKTMNVWSKNCSVLKKSVVIKTWYQRQQGYLISTTFQKSYKIKESKPNLHDEFSGG